MALYREFKFGDGVLYGALSRVLKFYVKQRIAGGAIHGGADITWDVAEFDTQGVLICANDRTPATVPEEGRLVHVNWGGEGEPRAVSGTISDHAEQGDWTYYSLFVLNDYGHWDWVAFALFLPVSDWDHGTILPRLLPGVAISDDMNVQSEPDQEYLINQFLGEMGFLLDEVKTAAEALVPFWDTRHLIPQAAPTIASLLRLDYIAELGPKAYIDLLGVDGYADNTLDVLGRKSDAVTRWPTICRLSINNLLNLNDSSAEGDPLVGEPQPQPPSGAYSQPYLRSAWVDGHGRRPGRVSRTHANEGVPPAYLFYDVKQRGYFRFPAGGFTCGSPLNVQTPHAIDISTWPSVIGGFFAKLPDGVSEPASVTLSMITKPHGQGIQQVNQGMRHPVFSAAVTSHTWEWFSSDGVLPLGTDKLGYPHLSIGGRGISAAVVDLDIVLLGPGVGTAINIPVCNATETKTHPGKVFLQVSRAPKYGTAIVNWGEDLPETEITWERLAAVGATFTYVGNVYQPPGRVHITVKDFHDEWLYCSTALQLTELDRGPRP